MATWVSEFESYLENFDQRSPACDDGEFAGILVCWQASMVFITGETLSPMRMLSTHPVLKTQTNGQKHTNPELCQM